MKQAIHLPFDLPTEPEVVDILAPSDYEGYERNKLDDCELIEKPNGKRVWVHRMFLLEL